MIVLCTSVRTRSIRAIILNTSISCLRSSPCFTIMLWVMFRDKVVASVFWNPNQIGFWEIRTSQLFYRDDRRRTCHMSRKMQLGLYLKKVRPSRYWNHFIFFSFRNSCALLLYFVYFQHQNEDHLTIETILTGPIRPNCEVLLYIYYMYYNYSIQLTLHIQQRRTLYQSK